MCVGKERQKENDKKNKYLYAKIEFEKCIKSFCTTLLNI